MKATYSGVYFFCVECQMSRRKLPCEHYDDVSWANIMENGFWKNDASPPVRFAFTLDIKQWKGLLFSV